MRERSVLTDSRDSQARSALGMASANPSVTAERTGETQTRMEETSSEQPVSQRRCEVE